MVVVCLLYSFATEALYKTRIYIVNKTDEVFARGPVTEEKGDKIEARLKSSRGKKPKLSNYTCKYTGVPIWTCIFNKRLVIPSSVEKDIITKKELKIKPGKTVKIAELDRDQLSAELVKWKRFFPEYENPNPSRFKFREWSPIYPYEQIATRLNCVDGSVSLVAASERVGLSNMFGKSVASGAVGGLGGGVLGAGIGTAIMGKFLAGAVMIETAAMIGEGIGKTAATITAVAGVALGGAVKLIPYVAVGGIVVTGLAAVASLGIMTGLAQRSGLIVLPVVEGDYEVSYSSKLRFGNIYKDVYLTIEKKTSKELKAEAAKK